MSSPASQNARIGINQGAESGGSDNRRGFLRESSILIAGAMPGRLPTGESQASSGRTERIGLLGCGRRGIQLASQLLEDNQFTKLVVVADVLPDAVQRCVRTLSSKYRDQLDLLPSGRLTGITAEAALLEKNFDTLIIAGCPADRPRQIESAIHRDIGVVSARPIAIDASGLARFEASRQAAATRGLRLEVPNELLGNSKVQQSIGFVCSGGIGRVLSLRALATARPIPSLANRPRESAEVNRIRNWQHYPPLSGGGPLEELADRLDICNQIAGSSPKTAQGIGGGTGPETVGSIDRLAVELEYGHLRLHAFWRRSTVDCPGDFSGCTLSAHGTHGWCDILGGRCMDHENRTYWIANESTGDAITNSICPNNALRATTAAIMARDAAQSGRCISSASLA